MYNPKPSSAKILSTSIKMSGEMSSLHERSTCHSRFNDNASVVEVSLHERSILRSIHSRCRNPETSQHTGSHRSIHSIMRRSSRELSSMEDPSIDSRHSRVRDQIQEEIMSIAEPSCDSTRHSRVRDQIQEEIISVAERSYDSTRHSRLRDQVQEELSVAEECSSYQSKQQHSQHSSVYHDEYHDEEEMMPLFDPLLAHSSRPNKNNNGVPAILTVPKRPASSLHYKSTTEAASLPDKMPHHHSMRLSFDSHDGTHAMSMPDRIISSSHNNNGGFAGGLALNHPSAMNRQSWEPSHAVKPKTTIKNSKKIRNKLYPSLLETRSSLSSDNSSSLDGRPPRPNSNKSLLGFSKVSYFYGNGVIVSGGPPNEIFLDEFGNKCSQYVNRTVVINDHQASYAASKFKKDDDEITNKKKETFFTGDSFRYRAILLFFMASTVLLLLMIVLGVGREKPLVIRDYPTGDDIFFDDDDVYSRNDDATFVPVVVAAEPRSGIILP